MGRPLNKKHFGTGAGADFKVRARLASGAEGYGYIVKQTATKTFDVNIDGVVGRCKLVDKANGSLVAGEMTISARNTTPSVKRVVKISGRTCTLNDGTIVKWDFNAASAGKVEMEEEADTFSAPPVITITSQPVDRSVTAPAATTFAVTATATQSATRTYQWQVKIGAAAFVNVVNGGANNVSGVTTATLTIGTTSTNLTGNQYRCVVSAAGATSVNSTAVTLTVA